MRIKREGILLKKTRKGFENEAVFNPAVIQDNSEIHLFYRAVRKGNYSTIGHCVLDGPLGVKSRRANPILIPESNFEKHGIEDPRIVKIEDTFYMTYSVYDGVNVQGAYATSTDLKTFKKQKIITPKFTYNEYMHLIECCNGLNEKYSYHYKMFHDHGLTEELAKKLYVWDKNIMFFPRKIKGKFALLHRIHPGIQLVTFKSFSELTKAFWQDHLMNLADHIVMDPKHPYESSHIGGGCPPIETKDGWLVIYHSAEITPDGFVYHASAALLDINNPKKELARLRKPLLSPSTIWEKKGVVNNIIFPSGTLVLKDRLYIYYGAADTSVAVASVNLNSLLDELNKTKNGKQNK